MKKTGFISFSDVAPSSSGRSQGAGRSVGASEDNALAAPVYTLSDGEASLHQISKRLQKKDGTTRLKALVDLVQELTGFGKSNPDATASIGFLPFFLHTFERMWVENDRRIREELFKCLFLLIENVGKADAKKQALAPYMKALIGPWWMCLSDPCAEVASAAEKAFNHVIPVKKVPSVLEHLSPCILKRIQLVLEASPPNSGSDDQRVEAEEAYCRHYKSAVAALGRLLDRVSPDGVVKMAQSQPLPPAGTLNVPKPDLEASSGGGALSVSLSDLLAPKALTAKLKESLLRLHTLELVSMFFEQVRAKAESAPSLTALVEDRCALGQLVATLVTLVASCTKRMQKAKRSGGGSLKQQQQQQHGGAAPVSAAAAQDALFRDACGTVRALVAVLRASPRPWSDDGTLTMRAPDDDDAAGASDSSNGGKNKKGGGSSSSGQLSFLALLEALRVSCAPLLHMFLLPLVAAVPPSVVGLHGCSGERERLDRLAFVAWLRQAVAACAPNNNDYGTSDTSAGKGSSVDADNATTAVALTETLLFLLLRKEASSSRVGGSEGDGRAVELASLLATCVVNALSAVAAATDGTTIMDISSSSIASANSPSRVVGNPRTRSRTKSSGDADLEAGLSRVLIKLHTASDGDAWGAGFWATLQTHLEGCLGLAAGVSVNTASGVVEGRFGVAERVLAQCLRGAGAGSSGGVTSRSGLIGVSATIVRATAARRYLGTAAADAGSSTVAADASLLVTLLRAGALSLTDDAALVTSYICPEDQDTHASPLLVLQQQYQCGSSSDTRLIRGLVRLFAQAAKAASPTTTTPLALDRLLTALLAPPVSWGLDDSVSVACDVIGEFSSSADGDCDGDGAADLTTALAAALVAEWGGSTSTTTNGAPVAAAMVSGVSSAAKVELACALALSSSVLGARILSLATTGTHGSTVQAGQGRVLVTCLAQMLDTRLRRPCAYEPLAAVKAWLDNSSSDANPPTGDAALLMNALLDYCRQCFQRRGLSEPRAEEQWRQIHAELFPCLPAARKRGVVLALLEGRSLRDSLAASSDNDDAVDAVASDLLTVADLLRGDVESVASTVGLASGELWYDANTSRALINSLALLLTRLGGGESALLARWMNGMWADPPAVMALVDHISCSSSSSSELSLLFSQALSDLSPSVALPLANSLLSLVEKDGGRQRPACMAMLLCLLTGEINNSSDSSCSHYDGLSAWLAGNASEAFGDANKSLMPMALQSPDSDAKTPYPVTYLSRSGAPAAADLLGLGIDPEGKEGAAAGRLITSYMVEAVPAMVEAVHIHTEAVAADSSASEAASKTASSADHQSWLAREPYFSVRVGADRELQTEWRRLLSLSTSPSSSSSTSLSSSPSWDSFITVRAPLPLNVVLQQQQERSTTTLSSVMAQLLRLTNESILSLLVVRGDPSTDVIAATTAACDLIVLAGLAIDNSSSDNNSDKGTDIARLCVGLLRGACVTLLAYPLPAASAVGAKVATALLQSAWGQGAGLWLPQLLHSCLSAPMVSCRAVLAALMACTLPVSKGERGSDNQQQQQQWSLLRRAVCACVAASGQEEELESGLGLGAGLWAGLPPSPTSTTTITSTSAAAETGAAATSRGWGSPLASNVDAIDASEGVLLSRCLRILVAPDGGSTMTARSDALRAVRHLLDKRAPRALAALLQAESEQTVSDADSGDDCGVVRQMLALVTGTFGEAAAGSATDNVVHHSGVAMVLAQALDELYAARPGPGAGSALSKLLRTTNGELDAPAEQSEEEEQQRDAAVFRAVLGPRLEKALLHACQTVRAALLAGRLVRRDRNNNSNSRNAPDVGLSLRNAQSAMMVWLLALQRVDSAAQAVDKGWYLRACCGAHMRREGVQVIEQLAPWLLLVAGRGGQQVLELMHGMALDASGGVSGKEVDDEEEDEEEEDGDDEKDDENAGERDEGQGRRGGGRRGVDKSASVLVVSPLFQERTIRHVPVPASMLQQQQQLHIYDGSDNNFTTANVDISDYDTLRQLAAVALYRMVAVLPAASRNWYTSPAPTRNMKADFGDFVSLAVRPALLTREVRMIDRARASGLWKEDEMELKYTHLVNSGELGAVFCRDESRIETKIKLPPLFPLRRVEVQTLSKLGISEAKWRRWGLQVVQLLSCQDGTLVDGALLWKANMDREFEGVEPCPICYSVLHHKSLSLPTLSCPTCSNAFHAQCLHTWFKQSGKNKCVICQQPFPGA